MNKNTVSEGGVDEVQVEAIARACHEMNRRWCELVGDPSLLPWEEAEDWQRVSARIGVRHHLGNAGASPESSHESWLETKRVDGWVYGPVKDPEKKTHPCMVPYDQLPAVQRAKDAIFTAVVNGLR